MKVLVLNCGSSSIKFQLIDMDDEKVLQKGVYERVGTKEAFLTVKVDGKKIKVEKPALNHVEGIKVIFSELLNEEYGKLSSLDELDAVGHRVVHGGEKFAESVLITDEVKEAIKENIPLSPLHNPAGLAGIEAVEEVAKGKPNVAVFDTAFHQSMPEENFLYGIDYKYYEDQAVRKYGFHGTSHDFITQKTAKVLEKDQKDLNMISCHLGNGSSICAVKEGKSFDTTMGLTPLEGLVMGTRSGDLDPTVVTFLMNEYGYDTKKMDNVLNKESGVLGVSGVSSDFRDLENAANDGNKRADIALKMFANRAKRYVAGYMAEIGKTDAIVFTGGIGENSATMRADIMKGFEQFGIKIDPEKNNVRGGCHLISTDDSKVKVFVIATNEELMIARDTKKLV